MDTQHKTEVLLALATVLPVCDVGQHVPGDTGLPPCGRKAVWASKIHRPKMFGATDARGCPLQLLLCSGHHEELIEEIGRVLLDIERFSTAALLVCSECGGRLVGFEDLVWAVERIGG